MTVHLFLARHGNTFGSKDKVVWASSSTDYPLVDKGEEQACELARFFQEQQVAFDRILCGPLKRTRRTAEIISSLIPFSGTVEIDRRLDEIDYGAWSGRTTEEIIDQYGPEEVEAWNTRSIWPTSGVWNSQENDFIRDVHSLAEELQTCEQQTVLAISSNGKLRYFLQLCGHAYKQRKEDQSIKVKTGHLCYLVYENGSWQERFWNRKP